MRAIGIPVIVVSFLAVVCIVLDYQRNQNQIDQMLGMPADMGCERVIAPAEAEPKSRRWNVSGLTAFFVALRSNMRFWSEPY